MDLGLKVAISTAIFLICMVFVLPTVYDRWIAYKEHKFIEMHPKFSEIRSIYSGFQKGVSSSWHKIRDVMSQIDKTVKMLDYLPIESSGRKRYEERLLNQKQEFALSVDLYDKAQYALNKYIVDNVPEALAEIECEVFYKEWENRLNEAKEWLNKKGSKNE